MGLLNMKQQVRRARPLRSVLPTSGAGRVESGRRIEESQMAISPALGVFDARIGPAVDISIMDVSSRDLASVTWVPMREREPKPGPGPSDCSDEANVEVLGICRKLCDSACADDGGCSLADWYLVGNCVLCGSDHRCKGADDATFLAF